MILVDNGSYGTIRMHQERDYPRRISGTDLANPDFAALARAFGGWAEAVERTEDFAPALDRALGQRGIRLLHLKTDVEQISNQTTIAKLRNAKDKLLLFVKHIFSFWLRPMANDLRIDLVEMKNDTVLQEIMSFAGFIYLAAHDLYPFLFPSWR